jgi:hypothetical protein
VTTPSLILIGIVALLAGAIAIQIYVRRGKYTPLAASHERPCGKIKVELGMEATDMAVANAIIRPNAALARKTGQGGRNVTWIETNAIGPEPMPDDETYAARYIGTHRDET